MLLPAKAEVARQLRRYRAWERVMLAAPADHTVPEETPMPYAHWL